MRDLIMCFVLVRYTPKLIFVQNELNYSMKGVVDKRDRFHLTDEEMVCRII
jgi:hypothetical protein